jgi:hypothetical protein
MKVVRFHRSPTNAQKIQAYFPDITTRNNDTLTFSSFDHAAFELAIGLEGLTKEDYSFFENQSERQRWITIPIQQRLPPLMFLEIDIYSSKRPPLPLLQTISQNEIDWCSIFDEDTLTTRIHYRFILSVNPDEIRTSRNANIVPIIVNPQVINFAFVIGSQEIDNTSYLNITRVSYFFDIPHPEHGQHFLQFECNGRSESIRFYPTSVWLINLNE